MMEINNYEHLKEYTGRINYSNFPVTLRFIRRKRDFADESLYTNFRDYRMYGSIGEVKMNEVKTICNNEHCRCYIHFIDNLFFRLIGKTALTKQRIHYFLDNEISNTYGLHLIDLDDVETKREILEYLTSIDSVSGIGIFPSKSGQSLLFRSPCSVVDKYNEELGEKTGNLAHIFGSINLYIPEFKWQ